MRRTTCYTVWVFFRTCAKGRALADCGKAMDMTRSTVSGKGKQQLLIVLSVLVYAAVYVGRYSYSANIGSVMTAYGVSRADAGLVSTFFFFSYGAAQLVHAVLCKYYPKKYVIPGALLIMAGINFALFCAPPFATIKYLWMANGIVQALIWPTLVQAWGELLDADMMPRATFLISLSLPIGTVVAYGSSALFNLFSFWRGAFLLGLIIPAALGVIWLLSYDAIEAGGRQVAAPTVAEQTESAVPARTGRRCMGAVLVELTVVCACIQAIVCFVRDGLSTWAPVLLSEQFGLADSNSIVLTLILPLFGIFGSALAMRTNRWIRDFRALCGFFCLLTSVCLLGLRISLDLSQVVPALILMGVTSCLVHGVVTVVVNIMPLSLRDRVDPGFLSGLLNACGYVGSTVSAYGLGSIADGLGWSAVLRVLLYAAIGATVLAGIAVLVDLWQKRKRADRV